MSFTNSATRRALNPAFYGTMHEFHAYMEEARFYKYMGKQWGFSKKRLRRFFRACHLAYQVWKSAD